MESMFYPRGPTGSISRKHRLDFRHKLKSCKRRKNTNMESEIPRAYVARFEEPVFCPSGLASLISQFSYTAFETSIHVAQRSANVTVSTMNDVQCQDTDNSISNGDLDVGVEQSSTSYTLSGLGRALLSTSHAPRLLHPRPESHDIAQEEEGRRIRFALEDSDEYAGLVHLLHLDASPDRGGLNEASLVEQYETFSPEDVHSSSLAMGLPVINNDVHPDALAVDDTRRSYDFKDFIQRWRFYEDCHKHDVSSQQDVCSLIPEPMVDVTRNDLESCNSDMQGLRWDPHGSRREQALQLRRSQHPSRPSAHSKSTSWAQTFSSEVQYRFRMFSPRHRAQYSHHQLRNVLAAVNRNDIFYATGTKVIHTSLACPSIETTAMDLTKLPSSSMGMRIACLATSAAPLESSYCSDRVLLAGGTDGEYAILDLNSANRSDLTHGFVTRTYDGLVTHIDSYADRRSGRLRACLCSNDKKVRTMDITTGSFTSEFSYANATNCSAISPDGRLRALVGDSHETLITDAERGDILATLKGHEDHGFSCAWSEDGRHVATGAQDGLVLLWDARNWSTPIRTIPCNMSAARSLHFTYDGALVVGEDEDVVTIHDTKRPEMRQDICFFGSVAGVALLDGGDELVIANVDRTVGGLLSFQRAAQGLNGGTFGNCIDRHWSNNNLTTRACDSTARAGWRSEIVSRIFV